MGTWNSVDGDWFFHKILFPVGEGMCAERFPVCPRLEMLPFTLVLSTGFSAVLFKMQCPWRNGTVPESLRFLVKAG